MSKASISLGVLVKVLDGRWKGCVGKVTQKINGTVVVRIHQGTVDGIDMENMIVIVDTENLRRVS